MWIIQKKKHTENLQWKVENFGWFCVGMYPISTCNLRRCVINRICGRPFVHRKVCGGILCGWRTTAWRWREVKQTHIQIYPINIAIPQHRPQSSVCSNKREYTYEATAEKWITRQRGNGNQSKKTSAAASSTADVSVTNLWAFTLLAYDCLKQKKKQIFRFKEIRQHDCVCTERGGKQRITENSICEMNGLFILFQSSSTITSSVVINLSEAEGEHP